jgi:elongator complex protein 6
LGKGKCIFTIITYPIPTYCILYRLMASRAPPLLEPYLRLPYETSLILLSGVLGTSTNWLVHRYLHTLLASPTTTTSSSSSYPSSHEDAGSNNYQAQQISVILVSFLRDYAFWKDGCKRLGLDLDQATRKGSFAFVDGLTGLFAPSPNPPGSRPSATEEGRGKWVLQAATVEHFRKTLENAVAHIQGVSSGAQTVLVIDQPDLLLAVATDAMTAQDLRGTILELREVSGSLRASIPFYVGFVKDINESVIIESTFMHRHYLCR